MDQRSAVFESTVGWGWVGDQPRGDARCVEGAPIPPAWRREVVRVRLDCGIEVAVEHRGLVVYDFTDWHPGEVHPAASTGRIGWTLRERSEASKPALVQRLRVMNTHQVLVHAASKFLKQDRIPVRRTLPGDLYGFDHPDETADGGWTSDFGLRLPEVVVGLDRVRISFITTEAMLLSLEWLNDVVESAELVPFDLLNQAMASLQAHDYALAVTSSWTASELRVGSLVRRAGLEDRTKNFEGVSLLIKKLRRANLIDPAMADRLNLARQDRNAWLHDGVEPTEQRALESTRLAADMLTDALPDLTITVDMDLLTL